MRNLKYEQYDWATGTTETSTPWDFTDAAASVFLVRCPDQYLDQAYDIYGGDSSSTSNPFSISIDIKNDHVHQPPPPCLQVFGDGYQPLNLEVLRPVPTGTNWSDLTLINCGSEPATFTITTDDAWLSYTQSSVTLDPGASQDIETEGVGCPLNPTSAVATTVRMLDGDNELWSFEFTLDCSVNRKYYYDYAWSNLDDVQGAYLPPSQYGPEGRFYSQYVADWAQRTCGQSLTPNFQHFRDWNTVTDTVQYGIYDISAGVFLQGYSSDVMTAGIGDGTWTDADYIAWTKQLLNWWDEVSHDCYYGQLQ